MSVPELPEIHQALAVLRSTSCGRARERVLTPDDSRLPLAHANPDAEFVRAPLCRLEVRRIRPGGRHTSARHRMRRALARLTAGGTADQTREAREISAFDAHHGKACLLDHQQGFAEAARARRAREVSACPHQNSLSAAALAEEEIAIRNLESQHALHVTRLGDFRDRTLALVEARPQPPHHAVPAQVPPGDGTASQLTRRRRGTATCSMR